MIIKEHESKRPLARRVAGRAARLYYRAAQHALVRQIPRGGEQLIVFLTPGFDVTSGGILEIVGHAEESSKLRLVHHGDVVLCTTPGDPPFLRYSWFKNRSHVLPLAAVLRRCRGFRRLLIHVPEYAVTRVAAWLGRLEARGELTDRELHFNVMLQNIDVLGGQSLGALADFGKVTCTAAHEAYCNRETRARLGVPLHWLSVRSSRTCFTRIPYPSKENWLIVSPDEHPAKARILRRIADAHPTLKIEVIRGLHFEQFKDRARRAKWSLTFGEGLDGYFAFPIHSGSVSFAVFNDRFFTSEYASLNNVYPSWEALEERIVADIVRLDSEGPYEECWRAAYELLAVKYDTDAYRENLLRFYMGRYSFP